MAQTIQELVELYCQSPEITEKLIYINSVDGFCLFQPKTGHFKLLSKLELERHVYMFLYKNVQKNMTVSMTKDFIGQIKYRIYRTQESMISPYIALKDNKTIDVDNFLISDTSLSRPAFYYLNCTSHAMQNYTGQAPTMFKSFLDYVIVKPDMTPDYELQSVVQEMMGYYLLDTLEAHATFFLVGGGQNGKSVLLNVLRKLVGEEFTEAMSIEKLTTDRFAAASLVGKKINICSEEESAYIKSDKFKAMVSGDPISVERKYGDSFMWTPTVKYIFASNEMSTFSGLNYGLTRRIKIIPLLRTISEEEKDTKLIQKLESELSGIMAWAVEGAKRLAANKFRFSESKQMNEKIEQFKENISAAVLFFKETYTNGDSYSFYSYDLMYEEYKNWADSRGKKKQSYYVFIRDLEAMGEIETIEGLVDKQRVKGKRVKRINQPIF